MVVAGIDIGSMSAKALVLSGDEIVGWAVTLTTPDVAGTARQILDKVLEAHGLRFEDVDYIVSTGYGRIRVPFAHRHLTEISCHARGTASVFPDVRTILDMGGQDCKVINCDGTGRVQKFLLNDKCAAGTGRYLERVGATLGVPLEQIGPRSLEGSDATTHIDSFCAVFAQRDVMILRQQGKATNDILAAAHEALVTRITSLVNRMGIQPEFSVSGGIAKNPGVVKRLEKSLNIEIHVWKEPQVIGALGAALFARDGARKKAAQV